MMKVKEVFNAWLQGSRRSYAEGLALFDQLADPSMKERYGRYLHEVDDAACTDIHYNMLKGKLGFISKTIQCNPLPYRDRLLAEFVAGQRLVGLGHDGQDPVDLAGEAACGVRPHQAASAHQG